MYGWRALALLSYLAVQLFGGKSQSASVTAASSSQSSATSTREPITRTVAVAKGGHTFVPDVTQAEVGDYIEFQFYPKNHSVVRAAYNYPCIPFELLEQDKVGFFSGFRPVDAILEQPPTWTVKVNDTDPIFFYCSAPGSCINFAMVGVINPNATTSLEVQRDAAKKSTFMLQPGQGWPDESTPPGAHDAGSESSGPSPAASPTTSGVAAAEPPTSDAPATGTTHDSGLRAGAIAGIAIGGSAVILMAAGLIYLCGRNQAVSDILRRRRNQLDPGDFGSSGVQYVHAVPKHMSGMTTVSSGPDGDPHTRHSPALPGYIGPNDGVHPPPRIYHPPSAALSLAAPAVRSSSRGSMAMPACTQLPPPQSETPIEHPEGGPHEMDGGNGMERDVERKS